ncbi:MAG: Crp/Fnr family transcriptional regulator, partial [Bacteroidota bacterium]
EGSLVRKLSRVCIQSIEKCTLACISRSNMHKIYDETPRFERFGRLMAETGFIGLRKKTETFVQLTPEERYLKLVHERPKVIKRIPQHFIASFLGIKPQSLSRIRKRLLENL